MRARVDAGPGGACHVDRTSGIRSHVLGVPVRATRSSKSKTRVVTVRCKSARGT